VSVLNPVAFVRQLVHTQNITNGASIVLLSSVLADMTANASAGLGRIRLKSAVKLSLIGSVGLIIN
jgi:hypothetical protein